MDFAALADDLIRRELTLVARERFGNLLCLARDLLQRQVPGDFVETGIWRGGMAIFMASILKAHSPQRRLWVCDSFRGCQDLGLAPYPCARDDVKGGEFAVSRAEVESNFRAYQVAEQIDIVDGWFRESLRDGGPMGTIALLRFDADTYSATLEVLHALYAKVAVGGYVVIDDYCLHPCRDAIREFIQGKNIQLLDPVFNEPVGESMPCGAYWRKEG